MGIKTPPLCEHRVGRSDRPVEGVREGEVDFDLPTVVFMGGMVSRSETPVKKIPLFFQPGPGILLVENTLVVVLILAHTYYSAAGRS